MKFWDTSAIIPLILNEKKTPLLRKIAQADNAFVVWWGTYIECHSTIAHLTRERILSAQDVKKAREVLLVLSQNWTEISPSQTLRENTERILYLHPLKAADSLQLASAIVGSDHHPSGHYFVCLDKKLGEAASKEGFIVLPE